jgi:hypothetical protein
MIETIVKIIVDGQPKKNKQIIEGKEEKKLFNY